MQPLFQQRDPFSFDLSAIRNYVGLTLGAFIGALAVPLFYLPSDVAPVGLTGAMVILNEFVTVPIGLMVFLLNLPILWIAYRILPSGGTIVVKTLFVTAIYAPTIDLIGPLLPDGGISDNLLLNVIFAGVLTGIGGGIIIRAGGTFGGTGTIARIIQYRTGMPMGSVYLYTDSAVLGVAGLVFGWEAALLAVVALFMDGNATNYVLEGPAVIRTATIITTKPEQVGQEIMLNLQRGVTTWDAQGMYTRQTRHVLFVSVSRAQVKDLEAIVIDTDPQAFLVVGHGHNAYGYGFRRPKRVKKGAEEQISATPTNKIPTTTP